MKVAINRCWGGFSLSKEATELMAARGHAEAAQHLKKMKEGGRWYDFHPAGTFDDDSCRSDPVMIAVIEELGEDKASGELAAIELVDVPDGVQWHIHDYDGMEHVAENHRTW